MKLLNQNGLAPIVIIIALAILSSAIIFGSTKQKKVNKNPLVPAVIQEASASPTPILTPTPAPTSTTTSTPTLSPKPSISIASQPVTNNTPPGSGYSYQNVEAEGQIFPS